MIAVCSAAKMDFLAEAKKRAAARADCEIIDVEPLSYKVPEKVDRGKAVATVPLKRKWSLPPGPPEKLMNDAFSVRAGNEGLEFGRDLAGGVRIGERFMPAWKLTRDTNLGTVAERHKWETFALPPRVRAGFSKSTDRNIKARSNAAVVEISRAQCNFVITKNSRVIR